MDKKRAWPRNLCESYGSVQSLYKANDFPILDRRIKQDEYDALLDFLVYEGFQNVFVQDLESAEAFVPNFECEEPFAEQKLRG